MNKPAMQSMSRLLSGCTAESYRHCCSLTGLLHSGARGPLNQLLCGSVNRLNVTHFVENYTSAAASLGAYMVSLINLDLVIAVWSLKRRSSSNRRTRKCHPTWIENVPPPLFKVHVGWVWLVSVFVPVLDLLDVIQAQDFFLTTWPAGEPGCPIQTELMNGANPNSKWSSKELLTMPQSNRLSEHSSSLLYR